MLGTTTLQTTCSPLILMVALPLRRRHHTVAVASGSSTGATVNSFLLCPLLLYSSFVFHSKFRNRQSPILPNITSSPHNTLLCAWQYSELNPQNKSPSQTNSSSNKGLCSSLLYRVFKAIRWMAHSSLRRRCNGSIDGENIYYSASSDDLIVVVALGHWRIAFVSVLHKHSRQFWM